ncbi:MAG TPA: GtrA family protein [Candidatus Onthousia excrementipullorum]|uniref:GtrA family protein n=1 Tax=Candidatus Onthousia excrementipullorum TaxID=2840884 RepID=A0A9D1J302_9FIRM|nr:GtrA family protein [Candidatus Onthousia excrementipullorum]
MLKKFHIKLSKKHENLLIQIFKFAIVGGIATVIDFVFLYIFREFCHFPVLISNTLSFCISVIYNYIASVKWVFDVNKEKDAKKQFIIFIVFSVMGLLLNDLIMWISVDFLSIYYLLAKIIATSIVMIFNFVTRKMFLE